MNPCPRRALWPALCGAGLALLGLAPMGAGGAAAPLPARPGQAGTPTANAPSPTVPPATATGAAPTPSPTEPGTALPPVAPALALEPSTQFAGGTVVAWGAHYGCGEAGVELFWPNGPRLASTREDPFNLVLTLPASVRPGSYTLRAGCVAGEPAAQATLGIRPAPPPPVARLAAPEEAPAVGQPATWEDRSTAGVTRRDWSFGDGSPAAHGSSASHLYAAPGHYTVTLTVWDAAGRASTDRRPVQVRAALAAGRLSRRADGKTVDFEDASEGPFTEHVWDFGDGSLGHGRRVSHVYEQPGTYLPRLVASYAGPGGEALRRSAELGPLEIGGAERPNLALLGLELVQVNSADETLVAGRRTVARVTLRREGGAGARYTLRLRGSRADGGPLPGTPFERLGPAAASSGAAGGTEVLALELPQAWTQARPRRVEDPALGALWLAEPITLTATVEALGWREAGLADNHLAREAVFAGTGVLDLLVLPAGPAGAAQLGAWAAGLRAAWPQAGADLRLWLGAGGRWLDLPAERASGPGAALAAAGLAWRGTGPFQPQLRAVVLSPAGPGGAAACDAATTAGRPGLWVAAGAAEAGDASPATLANYIRALALQLGRPGAPGGPGDPGPVDPDYPRPDGSLDADGLDLVDLSTRPRAETYDYLSPTACAGGRAWWSAYGHGRLAGLLATRSGPEGGLATLAGAGEAAPPPSASDYAAIGGLIAPPGAGGARVTVDPVFHDARRRDPADDGPGEGDWSISLEDESGRALFVRRLAPRFPATAGGPPTAQAFFELLPWHAFTRRVVLREAGETRWSAAVPAAPPEVTLLEPGPGAAWAADRAMTARWAATDPAGLALAFQVDLSPDGGQTWRPLGDTLRSTELTLLTSHLPGCEACRLRVRASNGLLMGEALSAPFRIEAPAPRVEILAPGEGAVPSAGEPLWLEGLAYDHADGPLGPGQLQWRSSLDGILGTAPSVQTQLSAGVHRLELTALNSAGRVSTAQLTLRVAPARPLFTVWLPRLELPRARPTGATAAR